MWQSNAALYLSCTFPSLFECVRVCTFNGDMDIFACSFWSRLFSSIVKDTLGWGRCIDACCKFLWLFLSSGTCSGVWIAIFCGRYYWSMNRLPRRLDTLTRQVSRVIKLRRDEVATQLLPQMGAGDRPATVVYCNYLLNSCARAKNITVSIHSWPTLITMHGWVTNSSMEAFRAMQELDVLFQDCHVQNSGRIIWQVSWMPCQCCRWQRRCTGSWREVGWKWTMFHMAASFALSAAADN